MFALWKLILDHVEELYGIMDLTKTARDVKNSFMEVSISTMGNRCQNLDVNKFKS